MAKMVATPRHHIGFITHFSKLEAPLRINKALYPLQEVLVPCAVLSGAEDWVATALYGEKKLNFLRRFWPYENGTPSQGPCASQFRRRQAHGEQYPALIERQAEHAPGTSRRWGWDDVLFDMITRKINHAIALRSNIAAATAQQRPLMR